MRICSNFAIKILEEGALYMSNEKSVLEELGIAEELRDAMTGFVAEDRLNKRVFVATDLVEKIAGYEQVNTDDIYRKYWSCHDIMGTIYRLEILLSDYTGETIPEIRKHYGLK